MNSKMLITLHLLVISFGFIVCSDDEYSFKGELKFAQIIYRHGDRTPVDPYPNDPWGDLKYWPTGWGQLTNIGKMQQYELGEWLRHRYRHFLNETYSRDLVYIRSTDVDRTLMSAEANLAGLFPPTANQKWNEKVEWQPIPIHTVPEELDEVLAAKKSCPAYDYIMSELKNSDEIQNINLKYNKLYQYLTNHTGRKIDSIEDVQKIYNTLFIESLYNLTLPEWTKNVYPGGDMQWISDFSFSLMTYTRKMARLKTGPLLKEILKRFDKKFKGELKPDRSLWVYSAHDTTIANILNTLKLFDNSSPSYASCILLEMRISKGKPFISVFYKNILKPNPPPMSIPDCGIFCPLDKMFDLYSDVLPENWEAECKVSMLSLTYEEADVGYAMGILAAITSAVFLVIVVYLGVLHSKRREYLNYNLHVDVE